MSPTKEQILEALKEVFDPEIPVNIVDLGLVYECDVNEKGVVNVRMTLTAPGCGMGDYIANSAREKILDVDGVTEAKVEIVFDPQWSPDRISAEIQEELGIS